MSNSPKNKTSAAERKVTKPEYASEYAYAAELLEIQGRRPPDRNEVPASEALASTKRGGTGNRNKGAAGVPKGGGVTLKTKPAVRRKKEGEKTYTARVAATEAKAKAELKMATPEGIPTTKAGKARPKTARYMRKKSKATRARTGA